MTIEETIQWFSYRVEDAKKALESYSEDDTGEGFKMVAKIRLESAEMALAALLDQQEAEVKLPVCYGFEWVKNVQVSKQLAPHLKPYHGCSRGPMGLPGVDPCDVSMAKLLRDAKDFLLKGQDETFVCVPEMWYERCVKALEKIQEAEKNAPLTMEQLKEMDGQPVWLADSPNEWRCFIVNLAYPAYPDENGGMSAAPCGVDMYGKATSLSLLAECGLYRHPPKEERKS